MTAKSLILFSFHVYFYDEFSSFIYFEEISMIRKKIATMYGLEHAPEDVGGPTLQALRFHAHSVGMEAIGGEAGLRSAIDRLPALFKRLSTFMSVRFNNDAPTTNFHKPETFNKSRLPDYMAIREMTVYKAPGQQVHTLVVAEALRKAFNDVVKPLATEILPELDRFTARIVSDPSEIKSQRTFNFISKQQLFGLDEIIKILGKCFDPKDTKTEVPLQSLYARNADILEVVEKLEDINKETYKISGSEILKRVETIGLAMDILIDKITHKTPGYEFTPSVVKGLADACHDVATFVEFYSVYMFKLREQTVAVRDTLDAISKH